MKQQIECVANVEDDDAGRFPGFGRRSFSADHQNSDGGLLEHQGVVRSVSDGSDIFRPELLNVIGFLFGLPVRPDAMSAQVELPVDLLLGAVRIGGHEMKL